MKYVFWIILLIAVYKIVKDSPRGNGNQINVAEESVTAPPVESTPTSFEKELPKDYYPPDAQMFSSVEKLKKDYDFRYHKLQKHFEHERSQLKGHPEKQKALQEKHNKAFEEFKGKYQALKADLELHLKEQKSSEDKGLR